jgi:transcription-repair coupling factor (superfamily II helicase)
LFDELVDRFGDPPQAVTNLMAVARLKAFGAEYRIESISQKGDDFQIKIHSDENARLDGQKLFAIASKWEGRVKLLSGPQIMMIIRCKGLTAEQSIEFVEKVLVQYKEALKTKGELQDVAK